MQGICINTGSTTVLHEGQKYYVFDHGPSNYYVSKFDNERAHFGSFRKEYFKLVVDEPLEHPGEFNYDPDVDPITEKSADAEQYEELVEEYKKYNIDVEAPYKQPERIKLKRFVAQVSKYRNGYNIGDLFIISEKSQNGYYHVYLKDRPAKGPVGSYITNFFKIITPYDEIEKAEAVQAPERPKLEVIEPPVTITLPTAEQPEKKAEGKPKRAKQVKQTIPDGQLDIFDFLMEG